MVFYYSRDNKYSLNAVIAAVDAEKVTENIHIIRDKTELINVVYKLSSRGDLVVTCLSFMTTQLPEIISLVSTLRKIGRENILLVAGGPHATGDPAGTLLKLGFDVAFVGEAEKSFPEFIRHITSGEDYRDVPGIVYREKDELFFTGSPPRVVLDHYPPFPFWRNLLGPIEITRGCPWLCTYCQVPYFHGVVPRHRSIDNIMYYVKALLESGARDVRFITPNAFSYGSNGRGPVISKLNELVENLYKLAKLYRGRIYLGSFPSEVRPEFVTEETLRTIKDKVANKILIIGAQSGSEKVLKLIRRGHDINCVLRAVELCRKYGFIPHVDFIFGLPGEDRGDLMDSLRLAKKLVEMGARIHAHTFMPLPGTPLEDAPPGKIPEWLKKELSRMTGYGKLYGNWVKQEKVAWMIHNYIKRGIILGKKGWKLLRNA